MRVRRECPYGKHPRSKKFPNDGKAVGAVDPVKLYKFIRSDPPQSSVLSPTQAVSQNGPPALDRMGGVPEMPLLFPTKAPPLRICEPHPVCVWWVDQTKGDAEVKKQGWLTTLLTKLYACQRETIGKTCSGTWFDGQAIQVNAPLEGAGRNRVTGSEGKVSLQHLGLDIDVAYLKHPRATQSPTDWTSLGMIAGVLLV